MKTFELSRFMAGEQDRDYVKALGECESLDDLKALVTAYAELAVDAVPVVQSMTDADFKTFKAGLKQERRGKFAGVEWAEKFGAVLMPLPMLRITNVAAEYGAPFGVAWQRIKELRPDLLQVSSERP